MNQQETHNAEDFRIVDGYTLEIIKTIINIDGATTPNDLYDLILHVPLEEAPFHYVLDRDTLIKFALDLILTATDNQDRNDH